MTETMTCDFCGDEIEEEEAINRGNKVYCSEACAFEAGRSTDCAGRTDTVMSGSAGAEDEEEVQT